MTDQKILTVRKETPKENKCFTTKQMLLSILVIPFDLTTTKYINAYLPTYLREKARLYLPKSTDGTFLEFSEQVRRYRRGRTGQKKSPHTGNEPYPLGTS